MDWGPDCCGDATFLPEELDMTASVRPGIPSTVSSGLLIKLGSLVIHCEELLDDVTPGERAFDEASIRGLVSDSEIQEWLKQFGPGYLPVKREHAPAPASTEPGAERCHVTWCALPPGHKGQHRKQPQEATDGQEG